MVSIIIPIYNVEKYIHKCIDSLLNQVYSDIEIILVDDGSTDNCPNIIDSFAEKDDRIIVVHKENQGVSSARNLGLELARGEYVMFVDGDDWVDEEYVDYFLKLIEESGCEIGFDKNNYYVLNNISQDNKYQISAEQAIEWLYSDHIFVAVWNKIYKTNFLKENKITFNEDIWYGEGMLFNIECLQYVEKVVVGEKSVYHQTFNPDSAMRSFDLNSNFCGISSMWMQRAIWRKCNKKIEQEWLFHRYRFNKTIIDGLVRSNLKDAYSEIYRECVRNLRREIGVPLKFEKNIRKKIVWLCYFVCPIIMAKRAAKKFIESIERT